MKEIYPKVLIIGIDGATFALIKPWVEEGKLPAFESLLKEGAYCNLKSTIPPLTPPAWTSFMTGKNPGKHGLFNFIEHQPHTYNIGYSNSKTRRGQSLWKIISDANKRVGVINVPMTYPPEEVNGYMISGMDTPDEECNFIYPQALRNELKEVIGEIQLDLKGVESLAAADKYDAMLRSMKDIEEQRVKTACYLMEKYPVDVMMVVFRATDHAQHFFWHYMDPHHYQYDSNGAVKYKDAILQMYQVVDRGISQLIKKVSDETVIFLMSDHGAGPTSPNILFLEDFLIEMDLLKYKDKSNKWGALTPLWYKSIKRFGGVLKQKLPPLYRQKLGKIFPWTKRVWGQYTTLLAAIDWERTKAYTLGGLLTFPQGIWINSKGKCPSGIVNPGSEYEELINFLIEKLYSIKDPRTRTQLIRHVYRKDQIYHGPYIDWAPDLMLEWWVDNAFITKPSHFKNDARRENGYTDYLQMDHKQHKICRSGEHRLNGILVVKGGSVQRGEISPQSEIIDIAPTILYLLGIPIPEDMDGRVIRSAFADNFLNSTPLLYQKIDKDDDRREASEKVYSDEEEKAIEEKLRRLGYID